MLREAQDWLVTNVWPGLVVAPQAHGNVVGRSVVTHASVHAPAHTLMNLDIADFFGSVSVEYVMWALCRAALPTALAIDIAWLCMTPGCDRGLPQGAPTSPALANAAFLSLDAEISNIATRMRARYSRYVDDLAFSWAEAPSPAQLAEVHYGVGYEAVRHGLLLTETKTTVAGPHDRQAITGLVINACPGQPAVRAPQSRWRAARAGLHNVEISPWRVPQHVLESLRGLLGFLQMTDAERAAPMVRKYEALLEKRR